MTGPLASAVRENDVILISESDHSDEEARRVIINQLREAQTQGLTDLCLEMDYRRNLGNVRRWEDSIGELVREAEALGIRVHLIDDRTPMYAFENQYRDVVNFLNSRNFDFYERPDIEALSREFTGDDSRLEAFFTARERMIEDTLDYRNQAMARNIDAIRNANPDSKVMAMVGSRHVTQHDDIDEQLRQQGNRTTTLSVMGPWSSVNAVVDLHRPTLDRPDISIRSENPNEVFAYKDMDRNLIMYVEGLSELGRNIDIPWKNQEPIVEQDRAEPVSPNTPAEGIPPGKGAIGISPR